MSQNLPDVTSGRKATKYRGVECLNCGHPLDLSDIYCSYCGQLNSKKQLALSDFFKEFFSSIFTYDSRLRYTVRDLLFKPGTISRNYVHGQRLKYANPFRFYLSVSIIYFLIQGIISTFSGGNNNIVNWNQNDKPIKINDNIVTLNTQNLPQGQQMTLSKDTLVVNGDTIPLNQNNEEPIISEEALDTLSWGNRLVKRFDSYRSFYNSSKIKNPTEALDSLNHKNTRFNRWLYSKNDSIDRIKEDPFGFVNYLLGKIPFFLFFFAPFFALFFWLIYSKKKYNYMEHLVFIFHIFGFVFLALLIFAIPDTIMGDSIFSGLLFILIGPFYFYKALRNFYKQNRFITLVKYVFLNTVFGIGMIFAALIFFAITAAIY
ncbi:MAG TPA: DUF3667 domain-containing protein [Flavobacteriaceae bacterium]|nr:DUF3667 domain-containing protein [Flavobacteriaceae bacterium]MCB9213132.1 DUF3667 domain-containing protein [Alteromonas sp.]HPF11038.1 DUF3667 domain-containing protein [Flavobacteriaceae bacterium]HQU21863.1 DUF3667 domain-containing protein [Flavobacteriaceae bacterium]HQU64113.1 DUF3667 domain-containing protein [Flavobacteriaceae bacterium]